MLTSTVALREIFPPPHSPFPTASCSGRVLTTLRELSFSRALRPSSVRKRQSNLLLTAASAPTELKGSSASRQSDAISSDGSVVKTFDVVALSNLCVDIVLEVPKLPVANDEVRQQLLKELTAARTVEDETWEVGGNANFMISAARLGMAVASIGHVNDDRFGKFLARVLKDECVKHVERVPLPQAEEGMNAETLLCFVLVDPDSNHAFCSRYDFGPWPLLNHVEELPEPCLQVLRDTRAVYINGFCFDELRPDTVISAMSVARSAGAAIFFDPGPRAWTMLEGERRRAMEGVLDSASVVLVTREEGEAVTGKSTSEGIARAFLDRWGCERLEWVVVKNGAEGATLFTRNTSLSAPGFTVDVEDTVGCGDSFAAAIVLGYIHQHSIICTLQLANAVGAATATRRGAGRNVGNPTTVESLLSRDEDFSDAHTLLMRSRGGTTDSDEWENVSL